MLYPYVHDFLNTYHDYICEGIIWFTIVFSVVCVLRLPVLLMRAFPIDKGKGKKKL